MGSNYQARRAGNKPNEMAAALSQRAEMRSLTDAAFTADWAAVTNYDFEKQRVDVVLLGDPEQRFYNLPIWNSWGNPAEIRPIVASRTPTQIDTLATLGIALFPRLDSEGLLGSRQAKKARSSVKHRAFGGWFIPGEPKLDSDVLPNFLDKAAGAADLDKVGPKDYARVLKRNDGGHIYEIWKEDGTVVWKVKKLILVEEGQLATNAKEIARKGDATSCSAGAGTITGGSDKFRAGV